MTSTRKPAHETTPSTRVATPEEGAAVLLHALLASTHDAVALISPEGLVSRWNPAAEQLYGYRSGDILGRPFALVAPDDPPPGPGAAPTEAVRRHASGDSLDVEVTRLALPQGWLDLSRDITARKHAQRYRHLHLQVTDALFEARGLADILSRFLETLGQTLGWNVGEIWTRDPAANALRLTETWHAPEPRFERFAAYARSIYLPSATGLPGRVWETGRMVWEPRLGESDFFIRSEVAEEAGLRSGVAFPLRAHGDVVGVAVFLCCDIPPPDETLTAVLETVGAYLARALMLHQGLAERSEQDRPFKLLFDSAPIGMALLDQLGRIDHANPALSRMLGRPSHDLAGRFLFEFLHPDDQGEAGRLVLELLDGERDAVILVQDYVRADGTMLEARCTATTLPDAANPMVLALIEPLTAASSPAPGAS